MRNTRAPLSSWLLGVVCALLTQLIAAHAANTVPVMLWHGESSSSLVNPLQKTPKQEFERILAERLGKTQPPILVFVKDNFCIEDINPHKQSLQQLNGAGSLTYLTSVEAALSVFENLSSYNVTIEDDLESIAEGQLALVQVTDLNAIPEIHSMVKESSPNLVVALTGKSCGYSSLERIKRAAPAEPAEDSFVIQQKTDDQQSSILLYAQELPTITINNDTQKLSKPSAIKFEAERKEKFSNLTLTFEKPSDNLEKFSLKILFKKTQGWYVATEILYQPDTEKKEKPILKSSDDIYLPYNFSYHCSRETVFKYNNERGIDFQRVIFKLKNLQVQMDTEKFDDNIYDCLGFMSVPIWTGIFVTAILALIMIWGLTMIMDIRTMDRFDDPKGKTITISAQE